MSDWTFEPLTYRVGWETFDQDLLPFPLEHHSMAQSIEQYESEYRQAARLFAKDWGDGLYGAFVTLARPYARIEITGRDRHDRKIRVHAAVRGNEGTVLSQEPTADADTGGLIHLSRVPASAVPGRIVAALPPMAAGQRSAFTVPRSDFAPTDEHYPPTSWLQSTRAKSSPADDMRLMLKHPPAAMMTVGIHGGPDLEPGVRKGGYGWRWADFADGRYLIFANRHTIGIEPHDAAAMAAHLQRLTIATATKYAESTFTD